jgi:hypothetical protein
MKNQKMALAFMLVLVLGLFQVGLAYAEYAHIVNQDTHGTLSREGIEKMNQALLAQDHIALDKLRIAGEMVPVKKGTRVILEELAFVEGFARVKPEGEARDIWVFTVYLTPEREAKDLISKKNTTAEEAATACRIEGFFDDSGRPAVMIGEEVYSFGASVCGGQIINITSDRVRIKFQNDTERMYWAGEVIE